MNKYIIVAIIAVVSIAGTGFTAYMLGKKNAEATITSNLNQFDVKEISRLAGLEVNGIQEYETSDQSSDPGIMGTFKNFFTGRKLRLQLPDRVNYGCDLAEYMYISANDSIIQVTLPEPRVISYEFINDSTREMKVFEGNGVLVLERNEAIIKAIADARKLGLEKASTSQENISKAKQSIAKTFQNILGVTGRRVHVRFPGDDYIPIKL